MAIDFDSLTLGEVATIEDLAGRSINEISSDEAPKGNALAAIAMIAKRRSGEPTFSWNQAQALTLAEANELLGVVADEDEGKDESSPSSGRKSKPRS